MRLSPVFRLLQNRSQYVTRLPAWRLSAVCPPHTHIDTYTHPRTYTHTQARSPLQQSPSWWVVPWSHLGHPSFSRPVPSGRHILWNQHITAPWWLRPLWSYLLWFLRPITPTNMMDASDLSAKQSAGWENGNWQEPGASLYCCREAMENMKYASREQHRLYTREQSRHGGFTMKTRR